MPASFGARLRLRREQQGLALAAIAEELKIKLSLLEAVERDDVSHWPSGIYRRAFIRAYAHAIGLNPDVIVREFLELYPDRDDEIAAAFAAAASMTDNPSSSGGPPTRLRNIVGSAIGSLSRLGRGTVTQQPIVARGTPISAPDEDDIPPLPAAPPPRELWPVDTAREALAHRTNVAVPPPNAQPGTAEAGSEYRDVDVVGEVVVETSRGDALAPIVDDSAPATEPLPVAEVPPFAPAELLAADAADLEPASLAEPVQPVEQKLSDVDFMAVAQVCTGLASVGHVTELQPLLQDAATILEASGLIVWLWDATTEELRPTLVVGYSEKVLAQLPTVNLDADNPTAAAFRSGQPCIIGGGAHSGALVVPLVEPEGCAGVLAMEFQDGREQVSSVHAASIILAAALSQLVTGARPAEVSPNPEILEDRVGQVTRPLRVRR